jgi:hypothetical protein
MVLYLRLNIFQSGKILAQAIRDYGGAVKKSYLFPYTRQSIKVIYQFGAFFFSIPKCAPNLGISIVSFISFIGT